MKIGKVLLIGALVTTAIFAEAQDKFKISLGGMYVTNFETEMQMGRSNGFLNARINTKDQLEMQTDTNVFRLDGYYRFTNKHSLDFSYFSVNSSGHKSLIADIQWDENVINADAVVDSYFNMDIYKLNYVYSFYHNKDVELALTAGVHVTSIDLGLDASGTINSVPSQKLITGSKVTLPLPVFGFKGEYTILDKTLFAQYKVNYFFLNIDDYKGSLVTSDLNLEYRFLENYGVGIGYESNNLALEANDGDKKIDITNNLSGVMFYVSYVY